MEGMGDFILHTIHIYMGYTHEGVEVQMNQQTKKKTNQRQMRCCDQKSMVVADLR